MEIWHRWDIQGTVLYYSPRYVRNVLKLAFLHVTETAGLEGEKLCVFYPALSEGRNTGVSLARPETPTWGAEVRPGRCVPHAEPQCSQQHYVY